MRGIDAIKWVFIAIIIIGIITAFWAYYSAIQEAIESAKALDFEKWSENLVSMLLIGITLIIAGVVGEIIILFVEKLNRRKF